MYCFALKYRTLTVEFLGTDNIIINILAISVESISDVYILISIV